MTRTKLNEFKTKALANPAVKAEYDKLTPEYELKSQLINARVKAGLTQEEVAEKMGTTKSAICRLESIHSKNSPSIQTLIKFAKAVNAELDIKIN
ncbi:helix-turn-helix transcriptional regulator [Seleniivibrio woodruffii]|uniref:helix-turn-helix transcriptional regulator n=1 Tax=Seleniivibrio woodruffii TaxID=1078050 RepID=UPI00240A4696|nr:helix-turn-helix transcriptional regulator [Seleniivibrio woodruffii]